MRFFSDNAAPVHPAVLDAIAAANAVDTAYDGDALSAGLDAAFSELFERPVSAIWVATGTAANSLALAELCPPYGGIICHGEAHINVDECGAPEFFTHGAKLILLGGDGAKLLAETVADHCSAAGRGVHHVQPHAISITQASEYGRVYSRDEVAAVSAVAKANGLALHMDGARFANAVAHLGCAPADITWRAGVDALSFGFVKNGGMGAEALIFFDPDKAGAVQRRRKRAGHLQSKGRFLAAQIHALLKDDLWLANATTSNRAAQVLGEAAGGRLLHKVEANEVFLRVTAAEAAAIRAQGFDFYDWGTVDEKGGAVRLVTSWHHSEADVAPLAQALRAL